MHEHQSRFPENGIFSNCKKYLLLHFISNHPETCYSCSWGLLGNICRSIILNYAFRNFYDLLKLKLDFGASSFLHQYFQIFIIYFQNNGLIQNNGQIFPKF